MKIVAYYTSDTPYEEEVKILIDSLKKFNLPYYIKNYEPRGTWAANTQIKPEFLMHCLDTLNDDILYVDADAVFCKYPTIISLLDIIPQYIGVHKLKDQEFLAGTIWLRNCEASRDLLHQWMLNIGVNKDLADNKVLHSLLSQMDQDDIYLLPGSYTKIFDLMDDDPVIQHNQASRRFKKDVNTDSKATHIQGIRLFHQADGSFIIPRLPVHLKEYFSQYYTRIGNQLRFIPKYTDVNFSIPENSDVVIVGKGPSLDYISNYDLTNKIVICINDSIHTVSKLRVGSLFCVQQDAALLNSCYCYKATMLISRNAAIYYKDYNNVIVYNPEAYGLTQTSLTAKVAIKLVAKFNPSKIIFIGFDACIDGNTDYAQSIGYESKRGGDPNRFLNHRHQLLECVGTIPFEFVSLVS